MAQPNWVTAAGSLGVFPSGLAFNIRLVARPRAPATTLSYSLLNGNLPTGIESDPLRLTTDGYVVGTPNNVAVETIYTFTVRVSDDFNNIRDRTFSIKIFGFNGIRISTPAGELMNVIDSRYVDYNISVNNPVTPNPYILSISSGELPPGLQMDSQGKITGFPLPPLSNAGSITTKTYTFSVQLTSRLGKDSKTYSIKIRNQELTNPPNTRPPVILNNTPLYKPVDRHDPLYSYYLPEDNLIPTINSGEYFSFKIIGHDFDNNTLRYEYGVLPPGLLGDPLTGWITGIPTIPTDSIGRYRFFVKVSKINNINISSQTETYTIVVTNSIMQDVEWVTDANLGTVFNGQVSELFVKATSENDLEYKLSNGELPPNMSLLSNGQIVGRIPSQPNSYGLQPQGSSMNWTFSITAFNPRYPVVSSEREFTLSIYQKYSKPTENIYFKATPNIEGRQIIQSLLNNEELIPQNYLYRPDDVYFGKADSVKYTHIYGMEPADLVTYINAININHYYRKLVLGEIKTAIARDSNNDILYEVVYADIVDDLINPQGVSLPQEIIWDYDIPLDLGPYFVSNTDVFTSSNLFFTSFSFGTIKKLYPASVTNMRTELLNVLPHNTDQDLLPKWMTSQQLDGNTLGYVKAWVIAYTLPDKSVTIKNNINNYWQYTLNMIDFSVDRFIIDRSGTFNYDTNLSIPAWTELPSGTPTPDPIDYYDIPVLFPRKTILPKNVDY